MCAGTVESTPHLLALDGVRGIAIVLVILFHFQAPSLQTPLSMGWCGVDLFFVLSGFLITRILLATKDGPNYFLNFYARRTLRIFPLYYLVLVVTFLVLAPLVKHARGSTSFPLADQLWYWTYLSNWGSIFGHDFAALSHFWSLGIEEQFYLAWPLLVLFLGKRSLRRLCLVLIVGTTLLRAGVSTSAIAQTHTYFLQRATILRLDTLAAGAWLAAGGRLPFRLHWVWPACALSLVAIARVRFGTFLVPIWTASPLDPGVVPMEYPVILLAALSLVQEAAANSTSRMTALCRLPLLRKLGKHSYAMYVIHYPLVWEAHALLGRHCSPQVFTALMIGLGLPFTFLLSLLSWHWYEEPALLLKRYFRYSGSRFSREQFGEVSETGD